MSRSGVDPTPSRGAPQAGESVTDGAGRVGVAPGADPAVLRVRTAARLMVVSPHLDDAVLAVGALIGRRRSDGLPTEVVTVYTEGIGDTGRGKRRKAFSDYAARRREDLRALSVLDVSARHLGFRERAMRERPLIGPRQLFRSTMSLAEDPEIAHVRTEIEGALDRADTVVLAPLGIGNHVDHVAIAVAALCSAAAHPARDRILFYEDFNALAEGCRRRHPVARQHPFAWRSSPAWASPPAGAGIEAMTAFVRGPDPTAIVSRRWGISMPGWSCHPVPVTSEDEHVKFRAIGEYRSQTAVLGGGKRLKRMMRRSHRRRGGELLWQAHGGTASARSGVGG